MCLCISYIIREVPAQFFSLFLELYRCIFIPQFQITALGQIFQAVQCKSSSAHRNFQPLFQYLFPRHPLVAVLF